jgi:hypothetical protein
MPPSQTMFEREADSVPQACHRQPECYRVLPTRVLQSVTECYSFRVNAATYVLGCKPYRARDQEDCPGACFSGTRRRRVRKDIRLKLFANANALIYNRGSMMGRSSNV